jgi:hypothetical protein
MQSKIKSVVPTMVGGVQKTWSSDKGTFYKYTILWENGDTGEGMGKNPNPPYGVGDECTYEKSVNGQFTSFKGIKKVEGASGGTAAPHEQGQSKPYESYWDKPRVIHYKMKPVAYKLATTYFSRLPQEVTTGYDRNELLLKIDELATSLLSFTFELPDNNMKWARLMLIELAMAEAATLPKLQSTVKLEGIKQFVLEAEKCINTNAPA